MKDSILATCGSKPFQVYSNMLIYLSVKKWRVPKPQIILSSCANKWFFEFWLKLQKYEISSHYPIQSLGAVLENDKCLGTRLFLLEKVPLALIVSKTPAQLFHVICFIGVKLRQFAGCHGKEWSKGSFPICFTPFLWASTCLSVISSP